MVGQVAKERYRGCTKQGIDWILDNDIVFDLKPPKESKTKPTNDIEIVTDIG
jgi:hypothetical protein